MHNVKSGLSTRVVQSLAGWEQISMVEHYSKSLAFDDALNICYKVNGRSSSVITSSVVLRVTYTEKGLQLSTLCTWEAGLI